MNDEDSHARAPVSLPRPPPAGLALIRCDGAAADGRLRRLVALACALRDCQNMAVAFSLEDGNDDVNAIIRAGFPAPEVCTPEAFCILVTLRKPDIVILEGGGLTRAQTESLRRDAALIATIQSDASSRLDCDFAYYPPLPAILALGWAGARTVPRIGWEWSLLGLDPHLTPVRGFAPRPTLLVTMGDRDIAGLTLRAARLLTPLETTFRIRFVIGRRMENAGKVAAAIVAMKSNYETVEGADDLAIEYASADLALCAFGVSSYELAAFGVPAIHLGLSDDDARAASAFADAGMGIAPGAAARLVDWEILEAVKSLMNNSARRRDMRNACLATIDGGGATRIAADLVQALAEEKTPVKAAL